MSKTYKAVKFPGAPTGWGGPLTIELTPQRSKVVSVTGGGIHPVAPPYRRMTGGEAVDGFRAPPDRRRDGVLSSSIAAEPRDAVSIRASAFPTVNLTPVGQSGRSPSSSPKTSMFRASSRSQHRIGRRIAKPRSHCRGNTDTGMRWPQQCSCGTAQPLPSEGGLIGLISTIGRVMGRVSSASFSMPAAGRSIRLSATCCRSWPS
jgi:PTS system glucitol/sorbitol-specific IIB component